MWKFGNLRSGKLGIRLSVGLLVSMALAASCRRAPTGPIALAVPGRTGAHVTLAADGDLVAAVWAATSASGVTDIYLATSDDAGRTFAAPVRAFNMRAVYRIVRSLVRSHLIAASGGLSPA